MADEVLDKLIDRMTPRSIERGPVEAPMILRPRRRQMLTPRSIERGPVEAPAGKSLAGRRNCGDSALN